MRVQLPCCNGGEESRTRGYRLAQVYFNAGMKRACVGSWGEEQVAENRFSDDRKCSKPTHSAGNNSHTVVFVWGRVDESVEVKIQRQDRVGDIKRKSRLAAA